VISDTLHAMQEEVPVGRGTADANVVRFLWLRSLGKPMLVRIEEQERQRHLVVKVLDSPWGIGADGVRIGKLAYERRRELTEGEWSSLARLLETGFWQQKSTAGLCGVDGAEWIMHGTRRGQHHAVARWSPTDGPFRAVCLGMLKLARVPVAPDEIY
jgi:hypothetical protein